jgi:chromosome segregation ATPase
LYDQFIIVYHIHANNVNFTNNNREEDREQELKNFTELCESLKQEIASVKASNSTFAKQLKRRSDDLSAEIAKTQRLAQTIENLNERLRNAEKSGFEIEASLAETTQSSEYLVQLLRSEISSKDDQIQKLLGELKHTKEDVMLQTTSMSGKCHRVSKE